MIQYINAYQAPNRHLHKFFMEYGEKKEYTENQYMFVKGEPADRVGYIYSGEARTVVTNSDGDELTLFYIGEEQMICSEGLLGNRRIAVSVQAISPVVLLTVSSDEFWKIWKKNDFPMEEILGHLVSRLTLLSDYICCTHFRDSHKRIAYYLYSCCFIGGNTVKLTNQQIAAITGVSRVSVNRILNDFSKKGWISLEYRKIVVLQPDQLKQAFGSLSYLDENN